ncbi:hypothetical protein ScalyP_jg683 [Parmales sp. scaly parma]|nr:hypothetical protein ScalyP_jg683 [Parmales sp. scaly parma]
MGRCSLRLAMFALIYNIISSFKIINIGKGMYRPLTMKLRFGFPDFNGKKEMLDAGPDADPEKKLSLKSLLALVATGAGSPFLGDFKGVDEDSGTLNFELDANNLVDENGNSKQTQMPYFEEGWVDEDDQSFKFPWQKK